MVGHEKEREREERVATERQYSENHSSPVEYVSLLGVVDGLRLRIINLLGQLEKGKPQTLCG
jgi:hypothetical protein